MKITLTKKDKDAIMKAMRQIVSEDFWGFEALTISEFTPKLEKALTSDIRQTPQALEVFEWADDPVEGWMRFIEAGLDAGLYEEFFVPKLNPLEKSKARKLGFRIGLQVKRVAYRGGEASVKIRTVGDTVHLDVYIKGGMKRKAVVVNEIVEEARFRGNLTVTKKGTNYKIEIPFVSEEVKNNGRANEKG